MRLKIHGKEMQPVTQIKTKYTDMEEKIDLREIAYERGLEVVETTQGMNGYPEGLGKAIIGFETFEEAEEVAREIGGDVVDLCRRDGWQFWKNCGTIYREWSMDPEDYGDDYECTKDAVEWWDNTKEMLKELEFETPSDMRKLLEKLERICLAIENLGENEQVLINRDGFGYEVIPIKTLRYHIDVWFHEIGVVPCIY